MGDTATLRSRSYSRDVRRRSRSPREGAVQVSEVQRARLLGAMARVVAEQGVGATTVSRVVKRAGVSRRTFYELFSSCEDCFLAVFEEAVERASRIAQEAAAAADPATWRERARAGLGALLCFLEEEPALGRLLVVDALGAGPRVLARRARVLETLAAIVDAGRAEAEAGRGHERTSSSSSPPLTAEGTVGAVLAVIHARMTQPRDPRPLPELLNPLMGVIVLPYLGRTAAATELARPAPECPRHERASVSARAGANRRNGGGRSGGTPPDPLEGLDMRLTYRTLMVLSAIASTPGASNRRVGEGAGIHDQGQISKLLGRLSKLGLIHNSGAGQAKGESNAWALTDKGQEVQRALGAEP